MMRLARPATGRLPGSVVSRRWSPRNSRVDFRPENLRGKIDQSLLQSHPFKFATLQFKIFEHMSARIPPTRVYYEYRYMFPRIRRTHSVHMHTRVYCYPYTSRTRISTCSRATRTSISICGYLLVRDYALAYVCVARGYTHGWTISDHRTSRCVPPLYCRAAVPHDATGAWWHLLEVRVAPCDAARPSM
jgi:hypothetical protein